MEPSFRSSSSSISEDCTQRKELNADAEAWFPRTSVPCKTRAQDRILRIRAELPSDVEEKGNHREQMTDNPIAKPVDPFRFHFKYLRDIIERVIADPGHFEEVIDIFMQTLHSHLHQPKIFEKLCIFIFQSAIDKASFRYNAARFCILIQEECAIFKEYLDQLCLCEVEKNMQKPGFTLFLAELTLMCNPGNCKMLYTAVNKLLALQGNENIKTVCQTLKLAGFDMEKFDKYMMDEVITSLKQILPYVNSNNVLLIDSVAHLQENRWGHSNSNLNGTLSSSTTMPNDYVDFDEGETFYGPSGEEFTEEERILMQGDLDVSYNVDEMFESDPEMDEEIQAAFVEFLNLNK